MILVFAMSLDEYPYRWFACSLIAKRELRVGTDSERKI